MNARDTEKRIVAIYRQLHDSLDTEGIMLADMRWAEAGIDKYPEDDDRLERVIKIARDLGVMLCQK